MSKILVTGATGNLGAAITASLLKKTDAANITVMVRNAAKAEHLKEQGVKVVTGDYNDYDSMLAAFTGADKVYLVSGDDIPNRAKQHEQAVKAAKQAGVKHVVYSSSQRKNETETSPIHLIIQSHIYTEQQLKASGLIYTVLQHNLYADVIPVFAGGDQVLEKKTIFFPAGEGKTAFGLRTDYAEAGANVLLDDSGQYNNRMIELNGAEAITWKQIAGMVSDITGQHINYVSPADDEFTAALTSAGLPAEIIGLSAGFAKAIREGDFENRTLDLESILGRKPEPVAACLKSAYGNK